MNLFVGDVQGCAATLRALLDAARFRPSVDRLHLTGDLVRRGPRSDEVLRLARRLEAVSVLGNHDVAALRIARGKAPPVPGDGLEALLRAPDRDALLDWLAARPLLADGGDGIWLVHAGVPPGRAPSREWGGSLKRKFDAALSADGEGPFRDPEIAFVLTVRYCDEQGRRPDRDWPEPGRPYRPWTAFYRSPDTVVFGHWARAGLQIGRRYRGLDTGCVHGGRLTGWIAEEERFVSVPRLDPAVSSA